MTSVSVHHRSLYPLRQPHLGPTLLMAPSL